MPEKQLPCVLGHELLLRLNISERAWSEYELKTSYHQYDTTTQSSHCYSDPLSKPNQTCGIMVAYGFNVIIMPYSHIELNQN